MSVMSHVKGDSNVSDSICIDFLNTGIKKNNGSSLSVDNIISTVVDEVEYVEYDDIYLMLNCCVILYYNVGYHGPLGCRTVLVACHCAEEKRQKC